MKFHTSARAHAQLNQTKRLIHAARRLRERGHPQGRFLWRSMAEIEEKPWNDDQKEIRTIGQQLFNEGGKDLMREVWDEIFHGGDALEAKQIENAWEGIGGWYR